MLISELTEIKATSILLKLSSEVVFTDNSVFWYFTFFPLDLSEANKWILLAGWFISAKSFNASTPTAPVAPTIPMFTFFKFI